MAKPPATPPHSDIAGVHQDGTRAGKPLDPDGASAEALDKAAQETAARPDHSEGESADQRTE